MEGSAAEPTPSRSAAPPGSPRGVRRGPRSTGAAPPSGRLGSARPDAADSVLLAVGIVAVATSGPLMAAMAAPALAIAFWRNGLGAAVTLAWVLLRHPHELVGLDRRQWSLVVGAGLLLALHFGAWVPSLGLTSVASATALVCLQPVWTAAIAQLRGFPVRGRTWVGIAVAVVGAVLLTGIDLSADPQALLGDALAVAGGVFGAAYVTVGAEVRRTVSTATYTTLCYATAAVALGAACVVAGAPLGGYDGRVWLQLVALTVGAQLLGHSVFNLVLRTTSSTTVSVVLLLEVPGAALLAAWWLGQTPPLLALPAIALMLFGVALVVASPAAGVVPALPSE